MANPNRNRAANLHGVRCQCQRRVLLANARVFKLPFKELFYLLFRCFLLATLTGTYASHDDASTRLPRHDSPNSAAHVHASSSIDASGHVAMHANGSSRITMHANGSSRITMHGGNGSSGHRRQLQLVGRVKAFEADLQYYVPLPVRTHPERTNLFVEPLGFDLNFSSQPIVLLQYLEHDTHWGTLAQCHGDTCPALTSCGPSFPNLRACWNPNLVDPDTVFLDPPVNCPKRNNTTIMDVHARKHASDGYDETCSHRDDFNPRNPMALQMFELKGAYVTDKGYVFNRTHRFVRPGCGRFNELSFQAKQQVHLLPRAFFWGNSYGFNFYHFIAETLPLLLVAAPLLRRIMPTTPILASRMQWEVYKQFGEALIGIKYEDVRVLPLIADDLFFVETLFEPTAQTCGSPAKALWQSLRRSHLLHPRGLPLFRPDWSYRPPPPLTPQQALALPGDWVVVVAKRPAKKRSISNFDEVEQAVESTFPRERVVKFTGSLSMLEARDLFRRTRLFVAGHGAALTNLIFMPERASVLEIRPDGCANACYNHLSYVSSLIYHLVFSHGGCTDSVQADVTRISPVLQGIKARFESEDGEAGR